MRASRALLAGLCLVLGAARAGAQAEPPGPEGLAQRVVDGKLRLSAADVVRLALLNDTTVRIDRLRDQESLYLLMRAHQAFDPLLSTTLSSTRSTSPTVSQLQGATTLSDLAQQGRFGLSHALPTGTRYEMSVNVGRNTTNSVFATFNPAYSSNLTLSLSQPLLRNFGLFPNRAPILIAERGRRQSRANLEARLSDSITRAVNQYWDAVEARESLKVLRRSLELADATYQQNRRALELGALPPLDIYRSEQQVASRRVQVIQAEYSLRRLDDQLRRTIGADLDPALREAELELTEAPAPSGELLAVDEAGALARALARRPELEAARQGLAVEDLNLRVARNNLRPDLGLTGTYAYGGRGGRQLDPTTTPPTVVSQGGLTDALDQIRERNFPTYSLALQLRLPLRNHGAQADLATAQVAHLRNEYLLRQGRQDVRLEVRSAIQQLEQAKASMEAARLARDLGQKNLEAEQRKFELGAETIFFVLEAQAQLALSEMSLLQAQIGYQRAATALDRATGALLEKYDVEVREPAT
jgi:outer membrane protein TolC